MHCVLPYNFRFLAMYKQNGGGGGTTFRRIKSTKYWTKQLEKGKEGGDGRAVPTVQSVAGKCKSARVCLVQSVLEETRVQIK